MFRSWWPAGLFLAAAVVFAATTRNVGVAVVFAVVAVLVSPLIFPRSVTHAVARERSAADGRPIVYWRPGCPFCLRLRTRLGISAGKVHWVNIWKDPEAAAAVRAIADGNETVPTVVAGDESMVNPDPAWVLARVRSLQDPAPRSRSKILRFAWQSTSERPRQAWIARQIPGSWARGSCAILRELETFADGGRPAGIEQPSRLLNLA